MGFSKGCASLSVPEGLDCVLLQLGEGVVACTLQSELEGHIFTCLISSIIVLIQILTYIYMLSPCVTLLAGT